MNQRRVLSGELIRALRGRISGMYTILRILRALHYLGFLIITVSESFFFFLRRLLIAVIFLLLILCFTFIVHILSVFSWPTVVYYLPSIL
jgi:hypothetical protein